MNFVRDNLAVCGFADISSREEFEVHGFHAQLQCVASYDAWLKECVDVKCLPFDDGVLIPKVLFDEAREWFLRHWESGSKILVSCAGGQSRSVTMSAALLSMATHVGFYDCIREVLSRVPGAYPHPYVLVSAASHCNSPLDFETVKGLYASIKDQPPYPWSVELMAQAVDSVIAQ